MNNELDSALVIIEDYMNSFKAEKCKGTIEEYKLPAGKVIIPFLLRKLDEIYSKGDSFLVAINSKHLNNLVFTIEYPDHFEKVSILFNGISSIEISETINEKVSEKEISSVYNESKYDLSLSTEAPISKKNYRKATKSIGNDSVLEKLDGTLTRNNISIDGNITSTNKRIIDKQFNREMISSDKNLFADYRKNGINFKLEDQLNSGTDRVEHYILCSNRYVYKSESIINDHTLDNASVGYLDFNRDDEIAIDSDKKIVSLKPEDIDRFEKDGNTKSNLGLLLK